MTCAFCSGGSMATCSSVMDMTCCRSACCAAASCGGGGACCCCGACGIPGGMTMPPPIGGGPCGPAPIACPPMNCCGGPPGAIPMGGPGGGLGAPGCCCCGIMGGCGGGPRGCCTCACGTAPAASCAGPLIMPSSSCAWKSALVSCGFLVSTPLTCAGLACANALSWCMTSTSCMCVMDASTLVTLRSTTLWLSISPMARPAANADCCPTLWSAGAPGAPCAPGPP
mmetsp:Transcript_11148/g.34581  ORF Transcript_11148/g.34581 Transcript_11148/m.34581 type:complete len:226 (-) Transcript_11148:2-679(-)